MQVVGRGLRASLLFVEAEGASACGTKFAFRALSHLFCASLFERVGIVSEPAAPSTCSYASHRRAYSTIDASQLRAEARGFVKDRRKAPEFKWQVLELHGDGKLEQVTATPDQLGLSPRDISIFAESKVGKTSERAVITSRNGAILFRTEIVKSVVRSDQLWLFHCR